MLVYDSGCGTIIFNDQKWFKNLITVPTPTTTHATHDRIHHTFCPLSATPTRPGRGGRWPRPSHSSPSISTCSRTASIRSLDNYRVLLAATVPQQAPEHAFALEDVMRYTMANVVSKIGLQAAVM